VSTGLRFTTLPGQLNPLIMTLTVAPLMGQISTSYAIKTSPYSAFCSRFDFNLYSYESELVVGCELWQLRQSSATWTPAIPVGSTFLSAEELTHSKNDPEPATGVLKARVSSNLDLGFAWEGRFRNVVFSLGATLDLLKANNPVKKIGCEMTYTA
jgi:mitochondrial distribution and morphology protein 10